MSRGPKFKVSAPAARRHTPALVDATAPAPTVRVALAGCGVVGSELVRLLTTCPADASEGAPRLELVRVLVRDPTRVRPVRLDPTIVTTDVREFLRTPADVTVEAINGTKSARPLASLTLAVGRRYVTANKALIATCGPELAELAAHYRTTLDFGAAVGGCIPVVRLLRAGAAGLGIRAVRGVLNGTTNYLLGRLAAGDAYDEALANAQRHGFAESEPRRDLSGRDSAEKLAILAWLAFGCRARASDIRQRGVGADSTRLLTLAARVGGVVKLVAEAVDTPRGIVLAVEPTVVPAGSALAAPADEANVVAVESASAGTIVLGGKGAGGLPTAGALFADLVRPAAPLRRPAAWRPVATVDVRHLDWLLALPQPAFASADAFCRKRGTELCEVPESKAGGAGRLVTVRCTQATLERLVEELGGGRHSVAWARWEANGRREAASDTHRARLQE